MKGLKTEKIRNVAIISHGSVGKTTLVEHLLFKGGAIDRCGSIEQGNTTSDYEPEEVKRKISINLGLCPLFYKEHKINLIDTPGYDDFVGEVKAALHISDSAVVLVSSTSSVEVGTEKVWNYAIDLPKIIFINRLDKENSNFKKTLADIQEKLSENSIPIHLPIGEESNFKGIIDLLKMKCWIDNKETDIPKELEEEAKKYKEKIIELSAEQDDNLMTKYLEGEELSSEEVEIGLKKGIANKKIFPVLVGSPIKDIGMDLLLNCITDYLPSPENKEIKVINNTTKKEEIKKINTEESFCAFVFKTTADPYVGKISFLKVYGGRLLPDSILYNVNKEKQERIGQIYLQRGKVQEVQEEVIAGDICVLNKLQFTTTSDTLCNKDNPVLLPQLPSMLSVISLAVEPKTRGDEEKISSSFSRLQEEDTTFKAERHPQTKQFLIYGRGELHLEVICDKLQRKFGVGVNTSIPKIPYQETIKKKTQAQGKYKRQSGGRGQYGDVWLELEPLPRGEGFQFVDKIVGGVIPKNYIPAVEKGVKEAMQNGFLAGYPIVDVKVTLYDGSYHVVDSSDIAFQIAGSMGFRKACEDAQVVILEPIMNIEVVVPQDFMGDIIGDLNGRRGRIMGTESIKNLQVIKAQIPQVEILRYATSLRSMTGGRGSFNFEFSHYEEVPAFLQEKIIAEAKKEKEGK